MWTATEAKHRNHRKTKSSKLHESEEKRGRGREKNILELTPDRDSLSRVVDLPLRCSPKNILHFSTDHV